MTQRVPDSVRAEIEDLYYEGLTINEIAARCGVSKSFVSKYLLDSDLRDARRVLTATECDRICRLYEHGAQISAIARLLRVWDSTVCNVVRRRGLVKRVRPVQRDEVERIRQLWREQPNAYRIAKLTGRSRGTVLSIVREHGEYYPRDCTVRYEPDKKHVWSYTMVRGG